MVFHRSTKKIFLENKIIIIWSPRTPCDRLKLLLRRKQAENKSDIIYVEVIAIVDKLIEHKCISTKQFKLLLLKRLS